MAAVLPASPDAARISPGPLKSAFRTQDYKFFDVPSRHHHVEDDGDCSSHHTPYAPSTSLAAQEEEEEKKVEEEDRGGVTQGATTERWHKEEEEEEEKDESSDTSSELSSIPETSNLVSPGAAADDTLLEVEPSHHVDYLSHPWKEEDIWSSWRYVTSRKHVYGNGLRLENASWRSWAKSKHKLGTISPETLNW